MRTLLSLYLLLLRFDFDELSECEGEDLVGYTSTEEYEGLRWVLSRIIILLLTTWVIVLSRLNNRGEGTLTIEEPAGEPHKPSCDFQSSEP